MREHEAEYELAPLCVRGLERVALHARLDDARSAQSGAHAGTTGSARRLRFRSMWPGERPGAMILAASTVAIVAIAAVVIVALIALIYIVPRGGRRRR
jgi:hypothetical protein